jgi:hypothetical protein
VKILDCCQSKFKKEKMVRAVRAPIQRTRAATEIPARQTIARAVRALRCALAESNMDLDLDLDLDLDSVSGCHKSNWDKAGTEIETGQCEGYEMFEDTWEASVEDITDFDQHNPQVSAAGSSVSSPGQNPTPEYTFPWHAIEVRNPPSIETAKLALSDLKKLLHPPHDKGRQSKVTRLTSILEKRLTWMEYFLRAFVNGAPWSSAALQTAQFIGKGTYVSRKLREWSKAYIEDRENLPLSKSSREWTNSRIEDEDLKDELRIHLQSLGKYVMASAIVEYLAKPDVQQRYNLSRTISLMTAERWMKSCGFRWTTAKNGQYVDGHEREDVVDYRQNKFLPAWCTLDSKMRKWSSADITQLDNEQLTTGRHTVVWFHDKSTFYAHDRRKKRWVHEDEKSTPQPKGQGVSLMVADFVSADYGWLRSRDGTQSARILFRAGKARDGYFSNDEIIRHAEKAMTILEKDYPEDDHVFVFDNATTHLKRAEDAISARQMPKGCKDWGINTPARDAQGNLIRSPDGKIIMQKVRMANGFHNGAPQEFYWPEGHEKACLFKGMAPLAAL